MKQRTKSSLLPAVTIVACILMSLAFCFAGVQYVLRVNAEAELNKPKPATKEELLELVNKEREKAGVAPLTVDARVQASAQLKADDMAQYGYLQHDIPRLGKMLTPEMEDLLYASCSLSGENFFAGTNEAVTAGSAIAWWMNSKAHHDAILNPKYTTTGFGTSLNSDGYAIQVQHFCVAK